MRRNRLFLVSVLIILIATLVPSNGEFSFIYLDKVVHFLLFLFLAINICYKYQNDKDRIGTLIWAIFFGLVTEVFQQFIPGRDMNIYDGLADTLGVILGYYSYRNYQNKLDRIIIKMGA